MSEAENKPSIRIHLDQQVTIEAVQGQEEVEDALVATEITGFDVEDDLYVLRGALSFSGFLRQEDPRGRGDQLPDVLDDGDIFATDEAVAEAPVLPFHHRLPFLLQVPVAAQQQHQQESGILNVNPKIGQWNVHVLGAGTVHVRAELIIQGLSAQEGYVFRCGSQEEGVAASELDALLDQEEARQHFDGEQQPEAEFDAPFEPVPWSIEEGAHFAEQRALEGAAAEAARAEDDWMIESPAQEAAPSTPEQVQESFPTQMPFVLQPDLSSAIAPQFRQEAQDADEEHEVVFTPDPRMVFPMPEEDSEWAKQLAAVDRAFGDVLNNQQLPYTPPPSVEDMFAQAQRIAEQMQEQLGAGYRPGYDQLPVTNLEQFFAEQTRAEPEQMVDDEEAFVLEPLETRATTEAILEEVVATDTPAVIEQVTGGETEKAAPLLVEEQERPVVAEYEFEDEIVEQEQPADMVPEVVQGLGMKAVGPKLSVGTKGPASVESPIKLSSLLGDSRVPESPAHAAESANVVETAEQQTESPSYQAAQLIRESQSYSESQTYVEAVQEAEASASVYTSQTGHGHHSDSIWGSILGNQEAKVTMKFRIVQEDDNLTDLAELYNTSINDLVRVNNLQRQDVSQGQILYIPMRRR